MNSVKSDFSFLDVRLLTVLGSALLPKVIDHRENYTGHIASFCVVCVLFQSINTAHLFTRLLRCSRSLPLKAKGYLQGHVIYTH